MERKNDPASIIGGNILTATAEGTVTVTVTIINGTENGGYTKDFAIDVTNITYNTLAQFPAGLPVNTVDTPHTIPFTGDKTSIMDKWGTIDHIISNGGPGTQKYVILDLSAITRFVPR